VTVTHTETQDQIDDRIRENRRHITNKTSSEIPGARKAYGPDMVYPDVMRKDVEVSTICIEIQGD
jgi:hypothetical protein